MARVLALDPGERVGWARADVAEDGSWSDLRHGITPLWDMAAAVHHALIRPAKNHGVGFISENHTLPLPWERKYDLVIVEEWRLYPDKAREFAGSTFPSVQFIGAVRLCCQLSGTKLVMQGARIKTTADKSMAALRPELYEKVTHPRAHDDAHDMDAIRHLWFHTWKRYPVTSEGVPV